MREHVEAKLRPSTGGEYRRLARLYIFPRLRTRQITEITRGDVARLHSDLRNKPYQANRTLALLSKFFN
jgi:hypothetical protein